MRYPTRAGDRFLPPRLAQRGNSIGPSSASTPSGPPGSQACPAWSPSRAGDRHVGCAVAYLRLWDSPALSQNKQLISPPFFRNVALSGK